MKDLTSQFVESLGAMRGTAHVVPDEAAAWATVRELVGGQSVYVDRSPRLAGLLTAYPDLAVTDDAWSADFGVSTAVAGAADTGTVAVTNADGAARTTGVTPEHHIVILSARDLVVGYAELVIRMATGALPSLVRLTTGPSRSGDIELKTIYGMHGPRTLDVVVIGA